MHDILIKNATIIDGTGKPGFPADITIDRGLISDVVPTSGASADTVIDATGQYVLPGFIDVTNHSDVTAAIFQDPTLESLIKQGITTIIGGNCGVSLAPLITPDTIHDIRKWAPTSAINVNWLSVKDLFLEIKKRNPAINFATLVGHGTLRRAITKEETRPLSLEEIAKIREYIKQALREGALGLSTNMGSSHEAAASADEMTEIAKILRSEGGIYKTHLRQEGSSLIASVNEALRVAHDAKIPVSISHLKAVGRKAWPLMKRAIRMIDRAHQSGEHIAYDITPYATTGSQLSAILPRWAREGGYGTMIERLRDATQRPYALSALSDLTLHFDRIRVAEAEDSVSPGKTIQQLADRSGLDPKEVILELLVANQGRVSIVGKTLHPKNIERGIRGAQAMISSNGAAFVKTSNQTVYPHPRSFGAFPHLFHKYVVKEKILTWEEAAVKTSSLPAEFFGIEKRGKILPRYYADLIVCNPATIRDRSSYDNPIVAPEGIGHVIVNGTLVVADGELTGNRAGQILRKN